MVSPEAKDEQLKMWMGMLYVTGAALLWSTGGVFIKSISLDPFQISFWRAAFALATIIAVAKPTHLSYDPVTIISSLCYAATLILFVLATKLTTAANAILLQYTAPIYILILGRWILGERVTWLHIVTVAASFAGMAIFFFDKLSPEGYTGNICAVLSGLGFGIFTLLLRKKRHEHPIDAVVLGNGWILLVCATIIMYQASFDPKGMSNDDVLYGYAISTEDSIMVAFLGILQIGIPYLLFTRGIQFIRAIDASLIAMLEPLLNPLWVFLFVGETPSLNAAIGGAIILAAVTLQSIWTSRSLNFKSPSGVEIPPAG
ncbi:MAG: EamA family transporter [Chlorobiales bacterium]|nr:EamA family transporter [Chlorobiales bacterium]